MLCLYIFALIIHAAFSESSCRNELEVAPKEVKNPEDLLGKWVFVYHWDIGVKYPIEFAEKEDKSGQADCNEMQIAAISPDYVKSKEAECAKYKLPFNWADAKLRLETPAMAMSGIIVMGEKDNWMMVACDKFVRIDIKKVSDYLVMANLDMPGHSELLAREKPSLADLKCAARNIDTEKGTRGVGLCYKN